MKKLIPKGSSHHSSKQSDGCTIFVFQRLKRMLSRGWRKDCAAAFVAGYVLGISSRDTDLEPSVLVNALLRNLYSAASTLDSSVSTRLRSTLCLGLSSVLTNTTSFVDASVEELTVRLVAGLETLQVSAVRPDPVREKACKRADALLDQVTLELFWLSGDPTSVRSLYEQISLWPIGSDCLTVTRRRALMHEGWLWGESALSRLEESTGQAGI